MQTGPTTKAFPTTSKTTIANITTASGTELLLNSKKTSTKGDETKHDDGRQNETHREESNTEKKRGKT